MDHLASTRLQQHEDSTINHLIDMWTLTINNQPICGNVDQKLYTEIYRPSMISQWSRLFKLTEGMSEGCDWQSYFRSFSGHPPHIHIAVVKFNARLLPVGTNLKRRRHADTDACFYCNEEETHYHIIQCQNPQIQTTLDSLLDNIQEWMMQHTSASIAVDIVSIARYYSAPRGGIIQLRALSERAQQQVEFGKEAFFAGLWMLQWRQDQEQFHRSIEYKIYLWLCGPVVTNFGRAQQID